MKTLLRLALPALLAVGPVAGAEWAGVLELKVATEDGLGGTARIQKGHGGTRARIVTTSPDLEQSGYGPFDHTVLARRSEPGATYIVNDGRRLWARDRAEARKPVPAGQGWKWTVKRLGEGRVAGLACERALLSRQAPDVVREVCVSREISGSTADRFVLGLTDPYGELGTALDANGLGGMFLRVVAVTKEKVGATTLLEVVRVEPRPVPATVFEVPAGYRETTFQDAATSERDAKRLEEKKKDLDPAQRLLYEMLTKDAKAPPR